MPSVRERLEDLEETTLSPAATRSGRTRGRAKPEDPHPYRTAFMRDRDRILHSKAFRRLAHKTQVFIAPEGDHYRVRLTHTLEVTQVARTIARALRLNEDLTEAICLGHDLGHTPFGHLGEDVLSEFLGRGFKHNEQSVRVVVRLENDGAGLNLTQEVIDGILNHTWSMPNPLTPEARIARYADRIAYVSHDIDDALRAGVLTNEDLPDITLRELGRTPRERIDAMVGAVVSASSEEVTMETKVFEALLETREFMFERVYNDPEGAEGRDRTAQMLRALLRYYFDNPSEVPLSFEENFETRLVDYVAGMTDRFAQREHALLVAER